MAVLRHNPEIGGHFELLFSGITRSTFRDHVQPRFTRCRSTLTSHGSETLGYQGRPRSITGEAYPAAQLPGENVTAQLRSYRTPQGEAFRGYGPSSETDAVHDNRLTLVHSCDRR